MKVAVHVDQLFAASPGGIGSYIRELVPAVAERRAEITLFHATFDRSLDEPWTHAFPAVVVPGGIATLYPRWNLTGRPALPPSLARADVVHAPLPAGIPPAAKGQRLVVTIHDLGFLLQPAAYPPRWRAMYRLGLRAAVSRADALIAPSRQTAEDLLSHSRVDPGKIHVIPEAASLPLTDTDPDETLDRLKIPRPYVLFVGTLEPRKNLIRLIRAYRRVADTGVPHALVLAGSLGWNRQPLLRELALAGPGEIVTTGRLDARSLDALYRGASAFAYVSTYEGFGLPVLEAMARGIPVVCSGTSSLPEVSGDAAVAVDPSSVPDIADALHRVIADGALAERLARAGIDRAAAFSWDEAARRTIEVYEG